MSRRTLASILASLTLLHLVVVVPATVSAGGGCHGPVPPPGDDQASVVKIDGCMFYPTIARVPVGTSVRFVNSGEVPHNVTGVGGTWSSQDLANGVSTHVCCPGRVSVRVHTPSGHEWSGRGRRPDASGCRDDRLRGLIRAAT
jgi:plastocyanin